MSSRGSRLWQRDVMTTMADDLRRLQRTLTEVIMSDEGDVPPLFQGTRHAIQSRFGVYRNNVAIGLIEALAARYPVVRRLLWDEAFQRVALLYARSNPPCSPVMLEYGEGFPHFIRGLGEGASADVVADIAELESARVRAYHAADARPLDRSALAGLPIERLAASRIVLHPSATLLTSQVPMVSIWESHQDGGDGAIAAWRPESALIVRPDLDVEVWRLTRGTYEFLAALAAGRVVADAVGDAGAAAPGFDLAEAIATLVSSRAAVDIALPVA
jgi:hypothetical protein